MPSVLTKICLPDYLTLYITADNEIMSLYIDGIQLPINRLPGVGTSFEWQYIKAVDIPVTTKVIAVHAWDNGTIAGILAGVSNGLFWTNATRWKCVPQS